MAEAPGGVDDHVFLDATHMGERFYERFPSITAACREIGIDPAVDRIPVAPAEHYACGGIPADLDGVTALPGFYAVGEVACTGVHGANRLASQQPHRIGGVAGTRVGRDLAWELPEAGRARTRRRRGRRPARCSIRARIREVRAVMSRHVGVIRDAASLAAAAGALGAIARDLPPRYAAVAAVVGGDEPAHGRRRRRRRRPGAHREPWLPPAHRLPRARRPRG